MVPEFKDFVFNSPYAKIASELMSAKRINLVMDNWFLRESGSKSKTPFHHDVSYFDMEGSMCVLWLPLQPSKKMKVLRGLKDHIYGINYFYEFFSKTDIRLKEMNV